MLNEWMNEWMNLYFGFYPLTLKPFMFLNGTVRWDYSRNRCECRAGKRVSVEYCLLLFISRVLLTHIRWIIQCPISWLDHKENNYCLGFVVGNKWDTVRHFYHKSSMCLMLGKYYQLSSYSKKEVLIHIHLGQWEIQ